MSTLKAVKIRGIGALALILIYSFSLLTPCTAAQAAEGNTMTCRLASELPGILSKEYLAGHEAKIASYEANYPPSEFMNDSSLDKAFDGIWPEDASECFATDGDWKQYIPDNPVVITVTFEELYEISKIAYQAGALFYGNMEGAGAPQELVVKASTSISGDDFEEVGINFIPSRSDFISSLQHDIIIYSLSKPVMAKRIQLVFKQVTANGASAREILFLQKDEVLEEIEGIYENKSLNLLKEQYRTEEALDVLSEKARGHFFEEYLTSIINGARKIVTGEVEVGEKTAPDFPVYTVQKTGPDTERLVWVFMGDGYTADQQGKFVEDVKVRVQHMFNIEPYKSYADMFNVYALCVVSNEEGSSRFVPESTTEYQRYADTYFHVTATHSTSVSFGLNEVGLNNYKKMKAQVENLFLDPGAGITLSVVMSNTTDYFGSTSSGTGVVICSTTGGYQIHVHEGAHAFGYLSDEYRDGVGHNVSGTNDPEKVSWKDFLGFRKVGMYPVGTAWIPLPGTCIMAYGSTFFCPVCEDYLALFINNKLKAKDKRNFYALAPEVTVRVEGGKRVNDKGEAITGASVTDANITAANGEKLEFRTMIRNLTGKDREATLEFTITSADNALKTTVSDDFTIPANNTSSIEVVTDTLSGLVTGDKISAKVIDKGTGEVLRSIPEIPYQTVKVDYMLGINGTEALADVAYQSFKVKTGSAFSVIAPELENYIYLGKSVEQDSITVQEDVNIKYYYAKARGKIKLTLNDETGSTVYTKERYLNYGETFTPKASDFSYPVKDGCTVALPEPVVYDGVNEAELIYTIVDVEIPAIKAELGRSEGSFAIDFSFSDESFTPDPNLTYGVNVYADIAAGEKTEKALVASGVLSGGSLSFEVGGNTNTVFEYRPYVKIEAQQAEGAAKQTAVYALLAHDIAASDYQSAKLDSKMAALAAEVFNKGGIFVNNENETYSLTAEMKLLAPETEDGSGIYTLCPSAVAVGLRFKTTMGDGINADGTSSDGTYTTLSLKPDGTVTLIGAEPEEAVTVYLEAVELIFVPETVVETGTSGDVSNVSDFQDIL